MEKLFTNEWKKSSHVYLSLNIVPLADKRHSSLASRAMILTTARDELHRSPREQPFPASRVARRSLP
ncbi:hypothetical protein MTR_4g061270 [Medicago truncatula]|uniref:Uncharacterized protein n=1 Tax=Medicago truncatula TaxID=3880 RepID=G7JRJ6_MEDTR|nr:hypothetical protein MTR_4g061270 [Medicago truncatula]